MAGTREYPAEGVVVIWEPARCVHAAECVRGLPGVFDPERRPWIQTDGVAGAELAEVVRRCPSGALGYRSTDPAVPDETYTEVEVRLVPNGPLALRGPMRLTAPDGTDLGERARAVLCRCGGSADKPFCDGTHRTNGFTG
jgi:uncharacterized Fe-S cluster protein YjdI